MTLAEVKQKNNEAGFYFFEPETMRFFGSRVESSLYKNNTFVTSEYSGFDRKTRAYTVRLFNEKTCNIDDVGGFGAYRTLAAAKEAAQNYKA